ncbi:TPA: hypothetical protein ACPZQN_003871 [Yersinia enterocolitica]|nr:hypothetical protein [Yersinia enterocolitica]HDL8228742.1 hypothetical protein [Yersinia enterocolitica]HDY4893774.1 hypothetical protein [Yersinia enterocolitica]
MELPLHFPSGVLPPANDFIEPTLADPQLTLKGQRIQPAITPSGTDEFRHFAFR